MMEENFKPEPQREIDPLYIRLRTIRKNLERVTFEDIETGEILSFPSIYRAGKFIDHAPSAISNLNGRFWKKKYKIEVLDKKKNITEK